MFLLSCGRESVEARAVDTRDTLRPSYETFIQKRASAKELRRAKLKNDDIWSHSASDEYDGDEPLSLLANAADARSSMMNSADSVAAQVRPLDTEPLSAFKGLEPALWALACTRNAKQPIRAASSVTSDEMAIPELHVGVYQSFCPPQHWSPAFASPGDFTIKMASVTHRDGETCFQIAVICSCIRAVRDGTRVKDVAKRKSFVKHVRRTQKDLARFTESMALRYIGHRLADKMPRTVSMLSTHDQRALDEYGEDVVLFLSYVLSITDVGFNLLVRLSEPVAKNILVREFLDLSLGIGDAALLATSSCDARLERQDVRPLLPSAWLDVDTGATLDFGHTKSCYVHFSPRSGGDDPTSRSFGRFSDSTLDAPSMIYRSQSDGLRPPTAMTTTMATKSCVVSKCTRFVSPTQFQSQRHTDDGAFTVEISGVAITRGYATYTISVLSYVSGSLEVTSVDRRFSEFHALAQTLEAKVESLRVRQHLPSKTLLRYLSASYLERRAASLQVFLEKLLRIHFTGLLDQDIVIVAEPNVRAFLALPSVEWSLVPWSSSTAAAAMAAAASTAAARTRRTSEWRRHLVYPPSPTVGDQTIDSTTPLFTPSRLLQHGFSTFEPNGGGGGGGKRRSDSM